MSSVHALCMCPSRRAQHRCGRTKDCLHKSKDRLSPPSLQQTETVLTVGSKGPWPVSIITLTATDWWDLVNRFPKWLVPEQKVLY